MFAYQTIQLQMSELHECLLTKQYNYKCRSYMNVCLPNNTIATGAGI